MTPEPRVSIVVPAYEEGGHIVACLDRLFAAVRTPCEVLVVCDAPDDSTMPYLRKYRIEEPRLVPTLNAHGRGVATALRSGVEASRAPVVVVTMADGSDEVEQVDQLVAMVERGAVVATASRYARGGRQIGGPPLKGAISRAAGLSLWLLARVGTCDATNSFKAYSRPFLQDVGIEADAGFEMGIELVAKARRLRLPVAELPTTWRDREHGTSRFKVLAWAPKYLRWYRFAFGPQLTVDQLRDGRPPRGVQPVVG